MKSYDVVIVNYNGERIIGSCLDSVFDSSVPPRKVIVFDNASQDNSVSYIKKKFPQVELIESKENIGFGRGNNEGMKRSESEYILFMNNDLILDKKCAKNLVRGFDDKDLAILNPLIHRGWDKKTKEIYSFGAELNVSGFGYSLTDTGSDRSDLSCFSGACFMAKADLIKKYKFEERFFLYYEEPELSVRLLKDDLLIGRKKSARCYHLESYSSPGDSAKAVAFRQFYGIQNRWYMLGKHWPTRYIICALAVNVLHLFYNLTFFLRHFEFRKMKLSYLAITSLIRGRRYFSHKRGNKWFCKLEALSLKKAVALLQAVYRVI